MGNALPSPVTTAFNGCLSRNVYFVRVWLFVFVSCYLRVTSLT